MPKQKSKKEPSLRAKKAMKIAMENRGNISAAMREAGYSKASAKNPKNLTNSKAWKGLMEQYLPDRLLAQKHKELINAMGIGHMVFPTSITDKEIKELLKTVNATVQKIKHSDNATHVWFWSQDNRAIKNALDLAYKLKGSYAPEKKDFKGVFNLSAILDAADAEDDDLLEQDD